MSQTEAIRAHLESGGDLTPLTALNLFGCMRLAARIDELRRDGLDVATVTERRGKKHWARYFLRQPDLFAPSMPTRTAGAALAGRPAGAAL